MIPEIIEKDLSYGIMQAAFEVHNKLGAGFLESIYERALVIELESRGYKVERQRSNRKIQRPNHRKVYSGLGCKRAHHHRVKGC